MTRPVLVAAALLVALSPAARSQVLAHSRSGSDSLGTVHFSTSCSPSTAPRFDRGVALLHSFEFGEAIKSFNSVLASDSTCAMAHWGIAMSVWTNPMAAGNRPAALLLRGRQESEVAKRIANGSSERERSYIDAVARMYDDFEHTDQWARVVAYERAMAELVRRQPSDTEAAIFHAVSLIASASPTDKSYSKQREAGAVLEALWAKQPNHPGLAHYIIHAYDVPPLANRARAAARRYANIAPSAAHALHMPSHTFTRVGMWEASIETNKRSMQVALATGAVAEALHAADYAMYAYLQLGRFADAKALLGELPNFAARFDPDAITGAARGSAGSFALAAIPARWALERGAWAEAAALEPRPSAFPFTEAMTYFARALGASHTGDVPRVRAAIDSLDSIQKRLLAGGESYWAEQVAIQQLDAQAALDMVEGRKSQAISRMREAVAREDATEKNAVTPGSLAPARELLADMLASAGKAAEARREYRAVLKKDPKRRRSMAGSRG